MKNLTTPQAILFGFGLVALAIASIPYSSQVITPALASNHVQKVQLCDSDGRLCAEWYGRALMVHDYDNRR